MVELDNNLRAQGGRNRAKNQTPEDRRFQAMLAASRRPLLHDVGMAPEDLVQTFGEFTASRHWFYVVIVGADGGKIPQSSETAMLRRLGEAGGAIGFLGVTMLGERVQAYYKPLKRGVKVIETLDRVSRDVVADVLEQLADVKVKIEG
jgi:hypothetical protein